jgi:hypothetical protein
MDVSNSSGSDTTYKVSGSGGSGDPKEKAAEKDKVWKRLLKGKCAKHDVRAIPGPPWTIEFSLPGRNGKPFVTTFCDHPEARIELTEGNGMYTVTVWHPVRSDSAAKPPGPVTRPVRRQRT